MKTYSYLVLGLLLAASASSVYAMQSADGGSSGAGGGGECKKDIYEAQLIARLGGDRTPTTLVDQGVLDAIGRLEAARSTAGSGGGASECTRSHGNPRTRRQVLVERGAAATAGAVVAVGGKAAWNWWRNS